MSTFHILLIFVALLEIGRSNDCKTEKRCQITRVFGMRTADCSDRYFKTFPQCIRPDIEVIDLSWNRLRRLHYADLERYRDLKALYLQENTLAIIDENAFDGLDDLTGLDLSGASNIKIPQSILKLPSLQSLYLNQLINCSIVEVLENAKPISSPLIQLDISFSDVERLPDLGLLPTMVKYNISGNYLYELGVNQFSGLCGLKYLIAKNVSLNLSSPCDCWNTNRWLMSRGMKTPPFDCQLRENLCEEVPFNTSDIENDKNCRILLEEIARRSVMKTVVLPSLLFLILVILGICWYLRRKRRNPLSYISPVEEESMNALPLEKC